MNKQAPPIKAYLALIAVYLIWGTTVGSILIGVRTFPPALLPCLRFFIAGILLVSFCLFKGEKLPAKRDLKTNFIIGALLFFGGNSIVCWTVTHMTTGFGSILVATTPLWMTWLSAVLPPREKISKLSMVGIGIGFLGMLILLSPKLTHLGNTSPVFWLCIAGLVVMTFCWSLGSIYARKYPNPCSLLMSVGLQNLFASLMLIPVCMLTISPQEWAAIHPSTASLAALAYLVLMGTIVATPCYLYVLKNLPVSVSSTFAYVTPVITVIVGWLFLGEAVTLTMGIGAAVTLAGVVLVQYMGRQRKVPRQAMQLPAEKELELVTIGASAR
jgi:drug/metabolite transporter (DMT)-like permease